MCNRKGKQLVQHQSTNGVNTTKFELSSYRFLIVCLTLVATATFSSIAQGSPKQKSCIIEKPIVTHFNFSTGLPASVIYKLFFSPQGPMFLAHENGLLKFDGQAFTPITIIPDEDLVYGFIDNNQILWLTSFRGKLFGLDLITEQLVNLEEQYNIRESTSWLLEHKDKEQLLLVGKEGFSRIKQIDLKNNESKSISDQSVFTKLLEPYLIPPINLEAIQRHFVEAPYSISISKIGYLIKSNKLYKKKIKPDVENVFFDGNKLNLKFNITDFICINNDLWISCTEGQFLVRYNNYLNRGLPQSIDTILNQVPVTRMVNDKNNNLWLGTYGDGLYKVNAERTKVKYFKSNSGPVTVIRNPHKNLTAVVTKDGLLQIFTSEGSGNTFQKLLYSKNTGILDIKDILYFKSKWILVSKNGLFSASSDNNNLPLKFQPGYLDIQQAYRYQGAMINDSKLHIGLKDKIYSTDGTHYTIFQPTEVAMKISSFIPYQDKWLIGTPFGLYINGTKKIKPLENSSINKIVQYRHQLFITTNRGLYSIDTGDLNQNKTPIKLSSSSGIDIKIKNDTLYHVTKKSIEIYRIRPYLQKISGLNIDETLGFSEIISLNFSEDRILVCGSNGIFQINNNGLKALSLDTPILSISSNNNLTRSSNSVMSNGNSSDKSSTIAVNIYDFNNNKYRVAYTVYSNKNIIMQSQFDDDIRKITLPHHRPGEFLIKFHVLQIKTGKKFEVEHLLVVLPIWYQTDFWTIVVICGLCLVVYFIIFKMVNIWRKKAETNYKKRQYLFELEAKNIVSQMNPHFIFNMLTPLQNYILKMDKIGALTFLEKFSSILRKRIVHLREKSTELSAEIIFLEEYVDIMRIHTKLELQFIVNISDSINTHQLEIPTMLLQPLIENAIQHGLKNQNTDHKPTILLSINAKPPSLIIDLEDNGKGIPEKFSLKPNHALSVISERINFIHQETGIGHFSIDRRIISQGTRISIILPLKTKTQDND